MKSLRKTALSVIIVLLLHTNAFSQITGPGGPFNTFSEVASYLSGVSSFTADMIYEVSPGIYEEQVIMPYLSLNTSSKIIFRKNPAETGEVLVRYAPAGADENFVIKIEGAHYQFENISFQNTSAESEMKGRVLTFLNTSNANDDNWFINCKFTGITPTTVELYSLPEFAVIGYGDYYDISNTHFESDTITGGSYGIYLENFSAISFGITITKCIISEFSSYGIYLNNIGNFTVSGNIIETAKGGGSIPVNGISTGSNDGNSYITENKIDLSSQTDKTCIRISNISNTSLLETENNMLTCRNSGPAYPSYGIILEYISSGDFYVLFNSIHIQDGNSAGSAFDLTNSVTANLYSFNNLFINTGDGSAMSLNAQTQLLSSGNNVYYTPSNSNVIVQNGIPYSLAGWQFLDTQFPFELTSFYALPKFVAENDLHIFSQEYTVVESRADANWATISGGDIDGEPRDSSFPDIGADEGMFTLIWKGDIWDNTVWHGTVFIEDTITVQDVGGGYKYGNLNIMPGTRIMMLNGVRLIVNGTINAFGEKGKEITFTSANGIDAWGGIEHTSLQPSSYDFCRFELSQADSGGVFFITGNNGISITNSVFYKNTANYGGAIFSDGSDAIIDANLFYQNTATEGGAIFGLSNQALITNNVFYDNSTTGDGGAAAFYQTNFNNPDFYNNTFFQNFAGGGSGHDLYLNNSLFNIYNCIFWNDITNNRVFTINDAGSSITSCIIKGNETGTNFVSPGIIPCDDPGFVNPAELNFALQPNSDGINSGTYITGMENTNDFSGKPRIFEYQFGGNVDIGAYELQAQKLVADAGPNIFQCGSVAWVMLYPPYPYTGKLEAINNPDIIITDDGSSIKVSGLPPGNTAFKWTVTNNLVSESDTMIITNTQPFVDAGTDIFLLNPDINDNIFPDTVLNGNIPDAGQTGLWTLLSASSAIINSPTNYITDISNIGYGQHLFKWTIDDAGCQNSDSVYIIAGHSYVSAPDDGILDWDNPADWNVNGVPGPADSVTVYNCTANINTSNAKCDRIIIGNGGNMIIEGSAKAPAGFSCRTVFIEQNAEKFKTTKGTANLYINSNATVNIGGDYLAKGLTADDAGLFIGGGGSVFIEQSVAGENPKLNIAGDGLISVSQNAGTTGNAELHIGDGAFIFIEQNAEKKSSKSRYKNGIYIGSGGYVFMEQNAEKGAGGYLHLSGGRTIFMEQNAEKASSGGAYFGLYGGTVFIEQNAEKSTKARQAPGLYCGTGGYVFIEQNAEKVLSEPVLISPDIVIDGGKIRVGNNVKSKAATARLQFRQIFIEQNAEKNFTDTALIINPSGGLYLSDSLYWNIPGIYIENGNAVTFEEGSEIKMTNNNFEEATFNLSENTSLIDYNNTPSYAYGYIQNILNAERSRLFSFATEGNSSFDFQNNISLAEWNESSGLWNPFNPGDFFIPGKAYLISTGTADTSLNLYGKFNNGDITVPLTVLNSGTFAETGWNILGNPYPSMLDLEQITLPYEVNNAFYIYDPNTGITGIYQQGGLSINGATRTIDKNSAFFVKADSPVDFIINNSARVHNAVSAVAQPANYIKLALSDATTSDETAIVFKNEASDNFDSEFDAVKFPNTLNPGTLNLWSSYNDDTPLAINSLAVPSNEKTIPLYVSAGIPGNYTLSVSDIVFDNGISVSLKDLTDNSITDLRNNPTYNFTYNLGENIHRFDLIVSGFSGTNDIDNAGNENNISVFSDGKSIYVNADIKNATAEIYNVNGSLIMKKTLKSSGITEFDTNLSSGIYFVKIQSPEIRITEKVVISK